MIVLGLTGSIGMGKSATATLFRAEGVPVHDSDAAVHDLYRGPAAALVEAEFPGTTKNGEVDRAVLRDRVLGKPDALKRLEAIVHPLVARHRNDFLARHREAGTAIVVLDIPLLFEVGAESSVDAIVVVSAPESVQKARVLERPGMTPERLEAILALQLPDPEKRKRADFIISTDKGPEDAARQVRDVIRCVEDRVTSGWKSEQSDA
jgi:dephospho-CoA kinase